MQKITKSTGKVIQGAYITEEIHEILKAEAKRRNLKKSRLASTILTEWVKRLNLDNARTLVEKADDSKEN